MSPAYAETRGVAALTPLCKECPELSGPETDRGGMVLIVSLTRTPTHGTPGGKRRGVCAGPGHGRIPTGPAPSCPRAGGGRLNHVAVTRTCSYVLLPRRFDPACSVDPL